MKFQNRYIEDDFSEFLKDIINLGEIEGKELGISKLVLDKGYNSLSEKQKYVFDNNVIKHYYTEKCVRCASDIPWCEMLYAYENNGMCGYCEHVRGKMMRD